MKISLIFSEDNLTKGFFLLDPIVDKYLAKGRNTNCKAKCQNVNCQGANCVEFCDSVPPILT